MSIDSRASAALLALADLLLCVGPGESLPSRQALAERAGVGIGTLARAFDSLTSAGAVALSSVPRAGTTVERIDYAELWRLAGRSILRGQLPMNLSVQMEAIEVAVESALQGNRLEAALVYREGARTRMRAVERGLADFAVVSAHAFESNAGKLSVVYSFGPSSYYGTSSLYSLRRNDDCPIRRVAVDDHSPDHLAMVRYEYPDAEMVATPFRLIPARIAAGQLDATVWFGGTALPVEFVNSLRTQPVTTLDADELLASEAVVVSLADGAVAHVFTQLDHGRLARTFSRVVHASAPTHLARV